MQKLVQGLHQFQSQVFRAHQELFERLDKGQSPETLFITCSDSRINPNLITQTGPGELFILRNVGNLVPRYDEHVGSTAAAIEFAVAALQVKDIVICGHSNCGAMQAVLDPASLEKLPATREWLAHAQETGKIIRENYGHLEGKDRLHATVEENVLVQLEHLRTHPSVAQAMDAGNLRVHGWVYKIQTGEVYAYDPLQAQFASLSGEALPVLDEAHRSSDLSI
ncbi:MAG TPA: carbonic anhydrase [Holophagaceae bacterium]|nr:carbonic anhydrase [Holophagaceae bacterium]